MAKDWREAITCEECLAWEGKPPIPLEEGRKEIREMLGGEDDFRLEHFCYVQVDSAGKTYHIPGTVMIMKDGTKIQWLPEKM